MAHANSISGATVYIDDGTNGYAGTAAAGTVEIGIPETLFTPDGWPTTDRYVGPGDSYGSGVVVDIDLDN
jgi:hypothetical protein